MIVIVYSLLPYIIYLMVLAIAKFALQHEST